MENEPRGLKGWLRAYWDDIYKRLVVALTGCGVIAFLWAAGTAAANAHPTISSVLSKLAICWLLIAWPLVTIQAWAGQRRKRLEILDGLKKGRPYFRLRGTKGFAANGSATHTDVVFWVEVINDGGAPGSVLNWAVWYEAEGLRLYGVDRWTLVDLVGRKLDQDGKPYPLIDEKWCLTRPGLGARVVPGGKSVQGALQFVLPVPLSSAVLDRFKVSCESSYEGPLTNVFSKGGPFHGYDDRANPSGPSQMVQQVNSGFFMLHP